MPDLVVTVPKNLWPEWIVEGDLPGEDTGDEYAFYMACTIPAPVTGFRGWRYRWWSRDDEIPFPDWRTT